MKLQANQLVPHLKNNLAPCYLVSGDEHLLVDEALDAIRTAARDRGFASRELHVAASGFDWGQLAAAGANLSLFAEQRIVELRLPTGKPGREGGRAISELVSQAGPDLLFVVVTPKLDRSTAAAKWVKALESAGAHLTVWPVGPRELPGWIAARMKQAGLRPERGAIQLVADRVEGNLLAASQEIEKLRLLLGEGAVSAEDVSTAVANSSRFDVYKLVDAALAGDASRAMRVLSGLRAEGVEPVIVVWAITRELRVLAKLADAIAQRTDLGRAMQQSGVWRNRQALVRAAVSRHDRQQILGMLKATGRADSAAKGQLRADPWQLAAQILLDLSLGRRRAA